MISRKEIEKRRQLEVKRVIKAGRRLSIFVRQQFVDN